MPDVAGFTGTGSVIKRVVSRENARQFPAALVALCVGFGFGLVPMVVNGQSTNQSPGGATPQAPRLNQLINASNDNSGPSQTLSASLRLGLAYVDDRGNSGDYRLRDFGSRLGWRGKAPLAGGLVADGYVELGFSDTSGLTDSVSVTSRQLWAGLSGPWGLLRAGRQHSTFYDTVSAATDIAAFGSCWSQFGCSRASRVLKYQTAPAPVVLGVSLVANPDDDGNDALDQFEYALGYKSSSFYLGLAGSRVADEGGLSGGNLLGAVLTLSLGGGTVSFAYQQTDAESLVGEPLNDDVTHLTLGLTYGGSYLIANKSEAGATEPLWLTVGIKQGLGNSASLFYEYQRVDPDDGEDEDVYFRTGFRYDF